MPFLKEVCFCIVTHVSNLTPKILCHLQIVDEIERTLLRMRRLRYTSGGASWWRIRKLNSFEEKVNGIVIAMSGPEVSILSQ